MSTPLFYKDKPIVGFDIGHGTIKIVQLGLNPSNQKIVLGYGFTGFAETALQSGVITDVEEVAKAAYALLTEQLIGGISSNRVTSSIPVSHTYTRVVRVPAESEKQLDDAIRLEVEQYVPLPQDDLYVDYEITHRDATAKGEELEILMVAAPRTVVDSYINLFDTLGLEIDSLETSLISSVRGVRHSLEGVEATATQPDRKKSSGKSATLLIDLGARSSDLSIFDTTIRVTGTIQKGGDTITTAIGHALKMTERQAHTIKSRHGLKESKYQAKIQKATQPLLDDLIRETSKMKRYYESRSTEESEIANLVILGGGANLPGLPEYLSEQTGLTTTVCDPWNNLSFEQLQEPHRLETTRYTTAVGLALAKFEEATRD